MTLVSWLAQWILASFWDNVFATGLIVVFASIAVHKPKNNYTHIRRNCMKEPCRRRLSKGRKSNHDETSPYHRTTPRKKLASYPHLFKFASWSSSCPQLWTRPPIVPLLLSTSDESSSRSGSTSCDTPQSSSSLSIALSPIRKATRSYSCSTLTTNTLKRNMKRRRQRGAGRPTTTTYANGGDYRASVLAARLASIPEQFSECSISSID